MATVMAARQQQITMLLQNRSNFPYSNGSSTQTGVPSAGGFPYGGGDRVTLGGNTYGYSSPIDTNDTRMSDGRTIEQMFADPYAGTDMGYLKEALDKVKEAQRIYGVKPQTKTGEKGDLRVIAGNRSDGVKPKEVRIDEHNGYDYERKENNYHDSRQETRFKDGKIGNEYDVTVTWEDGSTTTKRVTLKKPGQIVYMDTAYSY